MQKFNAIVEFSLRSVAVAFCVFAVLALGGAICLCAYYPSVSEFVTRGLVDGFTYACVIGVAWCTCELLLRGTSWYGKLEPLLLSLLAFLASSMTVYLSCRLGHLQQISDSAFALRSLTTDGISYGHPTVIYWRNYDLVISAFSLLFPNRVLASLFVNSLCVTAIVGSMYCVVRRMCGARMARTLALLTALSPSFVLYTVHLSGELLAVAILFYAAYVSWSAYASDDASFGLSAAKSAAIGMLLGLSQLFKPISFLYIMAWVVACVGINAAFRLRQPGRRILIAVCLMLASFMGTKMIGQAALNLAVKPEHRCLQGSFSDGFVKGLNVSSVGEFEPALAIKLSQMDAEAEWAYLKKAVARDYREYPRLFVKKFFRLYGMPGHYLYKYALALRAGKCRMPHKLTRMVKGEHVFFRIAFCIGAIGFLLATFRRASAGHVLPGLTSILVIMGFTALLMMIESAVRYKTSIYPFYFVMLAYCREIGGAFSRLFERRPFVRLDCGGRSLIAVSVALVFCALFAAFSLVHGARGARARHSKSDLVVPALDCDANFALVPGKLLPGYKYRFDCENIVVEHGAVDYLDVRLYDRVTKRNYGGCTLRVDVLSHSTGPRQWDFATPASPGDYQVRIHAGHIGHSKGIGLRCMRASVSPIGPLN